ncbi:hypothetical protein LTS07_004760 [Exophiala sideris]|uniref:Zn(2)-C6 fungal-type domain-containing protein n=1 Tax=Exophiala sideris TaxID=1016849 RepID=A0ABR0JBP8_9EURO|nr:hypothetical protein LTS07_004760 [Exophiala sideris]KAK5038747.1 hypothetical protein LTR13_003778 [Exophiala sideris]KAK5060630.1 hypothetical protein LTR69_005229 [Exophiala sideris]KAK5183543.1 hypothetical protein LTR44_003825 [Eurotiomycetes sp. CCFEE 6388]
MASELSTRFDLVQPPAKNRRSVACNHCRAKKIRCNGNTPCANCLDRAEECVVTPRRRPRIQKHHNQDERIILHQNNEPRPVQANYSNAPLQPLTFITQQSEGQAETPQEDCEPSIDVFDDQDVGEDNSLYATDTVCSSLICSATILTYSSSLALSIMPAVDWVISKANSPDYANIVKRVVHNSARMLKMSDSLSSSRAPDPPLEIAWQYASGKSSPSIVRPTELKDNVLF